MQICNIFSPSVALGDSSLIRGSLGRYRARRFFDTLKRPLPRKRPLIFTWESYDYSRVAKCLMVRTIWLV